MIAHDTINYKGLSEYNSTQSIVNMALSITRQGFQVMPMGANKKANWHFIPFDPNSLDEDGNPKKSTNLFIAQNEFPTNQQVIEWCADWRTKGMSLITGIITVIDIDVPRFFDMWLACDGVRDILERRRVPLMRSGGGGYQLPFVVSVPNEQKPKTSKVAWAKNEEKDEEREIAIEVKGFTQKMTCTYVMLPHSLHPNGNLYQELPMFGGSYANIPMIAADEWNVLFSAAKSICEAPKAKSTLKREAEYKTWQAEQAKKPKRTFSRRNGESPIDRFNSENDIEDMLNKYSYSRVSPGRWAYGSHRTGKSDISIVAGKSYHYNDNDPLANMGKKGITPFDVLLCFEYGGMRSRMGEAVRDLAELYRMDYATKYQEERQAKQAKPLAQPVQQPQPMAAPQVPQQAPQVPDFGPPPPDFGPPPPDFGPPPPDFGPPPPDFCSFNEYEPDEPSYDDLLTALSRHALAHDLRKTVPSEGYQRIETAYDRFDWNAYKAQVASCFDLTKYKEENAITDRKGGVFKSVCFVEFGHDQVRKNWGRVLRAAATYAGIAWPDFRRLGWTLDDTLAYARRVASNFNVIELEHGEYLSQVFDYNSLPLSQVTHIVAPCGVGKTRAADTVTPKSFYCPMSRQAETFARSANGRGAAGEVVCEGYMHESQDVIYGTYDAARKEIKQLTDTDKPLSLAGRTGFIDEVQHVSHDMYRKSTALEPLIDISRLYLKHGGRIVTLSGTPSPLLPFPLSFDANNVLHVKRVGELKRNLFIFRESDPVEAILARIKQGHTHITYSIDDKVRCELISEALGKAKVTALPIHSENKNKAFHKAYTGNEDQDGVWDPNVQVYVTTRATVDGFNVRINTPNAKLAEMFDQSLQYGSGMIEQRSRRVRNYPADVYVGMSEKALEQLGKGGHFGLDEELNIEFERAEDMLSAAKAVQLGEIRRLERHEMIYGLADNVDDAIKQANLYTLSVFKGWIRIRDDGELEIDALAINQKVKKRWVAKSHNTPDIMINELESLGFEFQSLVNLTGNKEDASGRKHHEKEVKRAKKEAKLTEVKAQTEMMSDTQAQIVLENISKVIKDEGDIGKAKVAAASLRRDLVKQGLTLPAAKAKIQALTSLRSDVIKRVENVIRQAKIRRAMTNSEFVQRADKITQFYAVLQDGVTFKIGDVLQSSEIKKRIVTAAAACGVPEILTPYTIQEKKRYRKAKETPDERHDSNKKILKLVGDMFVIERRNLKIDGVKANYYEMTGFNEVDLAEFVPVEPMLITPQITEPTPAADILNQADFECDQDVKETLTRLYENGWLTEAQLEQRLEELKANAEFNAVWE